MEIKLFNGILKAKELIFIIAWSLFILTVILQGTIWYVNIEGGAVTLLFKLIRYIAYLLCIWLVIQKLVRTTIIIAVLLLIAGLGLTMIGSTNKTMLLYSIIIIAAYGIESTIIIKVSLFWQTIVVFGTVILSQMGLIEDYLFGDSVRLRHGLGFCWGTIAPIMYFYCMLQYIYLRRDKLRIIEYIIMEAINVVLFELTDARMSFYLSTLFLAVLCLANIVKRSPLKVRIGKLKWFFCAAPTLVAIGSILLHAVYDENNSFFYKLNIILSKRLSLGYSAIHNYGINWIGQKIEWIGFSSKPIPGEYNYVDCSFLQLLLEYGILFLIIAVAIYTVLIWRAIKAEDNYLLVIICVILAFSITEPRLMNFAYNPFPVLLMAGLKQSDSVFQYSSILKARMERNTW